MVFNAHNRAFIFCGVPSKVIYNNPRTVMDAVFAGKSCDRGLERQFNRRLLVLGNHYLFEPVVCPPASGLEEGQIDNHVGSIREWLFTPTPRFANFAILNIWLATCCKDFSVCRYRTQIAKIAKLFALEELLQLSVIMAFDELHCAASPCCKHLSRLG
jgi:transposase